MCAGEVIDVAVVIGGVGDAGGLQVALLRSGRRSSTTQAFHALERVEVVGGDGHLPVGAASLALLLRKGCLALAFHALEVAEATADEVECVPVEEGLLVCKEEVVANWLAERQKLDVRGERHV